MASAYDDFESGPRRNGHGSCCAWATFIIWFVVIFLLIFGISFFAFVRSNLPEVKIHRLDVYKLNVSDPAKNSYKDMQLTIDVQISANMTNNNKKIELVYGGLSVETMIEGFSLPKVRVIGFRQNPMSSMDLKIRPTAMRSAVSPDDAKEVQWNSDRHEMEFNVDMKGKVEFWYDGRMMSKLRLQVLCNSVEQAQIDQALASTCNVKLSPFSS